MALPPQVLGEVQVGPLGVVAVGVATAEDEVLEDLMAEEEAEAETDEAELEMLELELELETAVAVERTEETTAVEVELSTVSTTLGGRVVLVASYPLEPAITTWKSSRQPPWLVAVEASRLLPHRVHLKLVMLVGLGQ